MSFILLCAPSFILSFRRKMLNILKLIYSTKIQMSLKEKANQSFFECSLKRYCIGISYHQSKNNKICRFKTTLKMTRARNTKILLEAVFGCDSKVRKSSFVRIGRNKSNAVKSSTQPNILTHYWKTDSFRLLLRIFSFSCLYISEWKIFKLLNHKRSRIRFKIHAFLMSVIFGNGNEVVHLTEKSPINVIQPCKAYDN